MFLKAIIPALFSLIANRLLKTSPDKCMTIRWTGNLLIFSYYYYTTLPHQEDMQKKHSLPDIIISNENNVTVEPIDHLII